MCGFIIVIVWNFTEAGMVVKVHTHITSAAEGVLSHHDVRHIF